MGDKTDQEITLHDIITTLEEEVSLVIESKYLPELINYFQRQTLCCDWYANGFCLVWLKVFNGEEQ